MGRKKRTIDGFTLPEVGENIRKMRLYKGFSGAEYADLIQLSIHVLNDLEKGKNATQSTINQALAALGYADVSALIQEAAPFPKYDRAMLGKVTRTLRKNAGTSQAELEKRISPNHNDIHVTGKHVSTFEQRGDGISPHRIAAIPEALGFEGGYLAWPGMIQSVVQIGHQDVPTNPQDTAGAAPCTVSVANASQTDGVPAPDGARLSEDDRIAIKTLAAYQGWSIYKLAQESDLSPSLVSYAFATGRCSAASLESMLSALACASLAEAHRRCDALPPYDTAYFAKSVGNFLSANAIPAKRVSDLLDISPSTFYRFLKTGEGFAEQTINRIPGGLGYPDWLTFLNAVNAVKASQAKPVATPGACGTARPAAGAVFDPHALGSGDQRRWADAYLESRSQHSIGARG